MKTIAKDDDVISYLSGDRSIISGSLLKMEIYAAPYLLTIDLEIKLLYAKDDNLIKLRFADVQEYGFYHSSDYSSYEIPNYKLCKTDDLYYLSMDPDEGSACRLASDNDFIICRSIEVYLM